MALVYLEAVSEIPPTSGLLLLQPEFHCALRSRGSYQRASGGCAACAAHLGITSGDITAH